MINRIEELIKDLTININSKNSLKIEEREIIYALFLLLSDNYNFDWIGDLWDIDIDYSFAEKLLTDFDFNILNNEIEVKEDIIPQEYLIQFKVRIKSKGLIWIIHKNDSDPFPSNPHAHNIINNIKLDFSNGKCYKKRKLIYTLNNRDLLDIREIAENKLKIELPQLVL